MSNEKQRELIEHLGECVTLEKVDNAPTCDIFAVQIEDIRCLLLQAKGRNSDDLRIFVDLGKAPLNFNPQTLQQRLDKYHCLRGNDFPFVGLCPITERVMLKTRATLSELKGSSLLETLENYVRYAQLWRKNYFLEGSSRLMAA